MEETRQPEETNSSLSPIKNTTIIKSNTMSESIRNKKAKVREKTLYRENPTITVIAAISINGKIGVDNKIPWKKQKADMLRFKEYTKNKPVLMGIKTFESLPYPLPDRINLVLTRSIKKVEAVTSRFRDKYPDKPMPIVINFGSIRDLRESWPDIIEKYGKEFNCNELIIAGGYEVYETFIQFADKVLLTSISIKVEGGIKFPSVDFTNVKDWALLDKQVKFADEQNEYNYIFYTIGRPKQATIVNLHERIQITKLDRAVEYETIKYGNASRPTN